MDEFLCQEVIRLLLIKHLLKQRQKLFHRLLIHLVLWIFRLTKLLNTKITILAVGWTTSIFCKIVAPSFVIKVSPLLSLIILSIPLGPRLVLIQSATAKLNWINTFGCLNVCCSNVFSFLVFVISCLFGLFCFRHF